MLVLLLLTLNSAHAGEIVTPWLAGPGPANSTAAAPDTTVDPVRKCLDDLRREKKKRKPEMQFKFHPVDAGALPLSCTRGDIGNVRQALQRQIDNCGKPAQGLDTID